MCSDVCFVFPLRVIRSVFIYCLCDICADVSDLRCRESGWDPSSLCAPELRQPRSRSAQGVCCRRQTLLRRETLAQELPLRSLWSVCTRHKCKIFLFLSYPSPPFLPFPVLYFPFILFPALSFSSLCCVVLSVPSLFCCVFSLSLLCCHFFPFRSFSFLSFPFLPCPFLSFPSILCFVISFPILYCPFPFFPFPLCLVFSFPILSFLDLFLSCHVLLCPMLCYLDFLCSICCLFPLQLGFLSASRQEDHLLQ